MRRASLNLGLAASVLCLPACGDEGGGGGNSDSASDTSQNSLSNGDGDGDSQGDGDGDGDGDTQGDGDGDGDDGGGGAVKWDVLGVPDSGNNCAGDGGNPEFSYLWASNSSQGTISKINTMTVQEEGRYITDPGMNGSPSRTSVSLSGHVAVANRNGGISKFFATSDHCQESNGMPGIQTAVDSNYLSWDQEECRAWHTPMNYSSQRPVAWGLGEFNEGSCAYEDETLWTAGTNGGNPEVMKVDGDTGMVEDMVVLTGMNNDFYGIYGAGVDGGGNFWGSQLGQSGRLVRVDVDDMTYEVWDTPNNGTHWYGMTVDSDGYVWVCHSNAGRFDYETETWDIAIVGGGGAGCMADAGEDGLLWMSQGSSVTGINRETLQVEKSWPVPGSYGMSVDFQGYVWAVAFGTSAHRVDPETGDVVSFNGLVGAYTYSDMTGFALSNAGTPSG